MAETSCIHLEPIMGHSELHNGRLIVLGYVRVELTIHNEVWVGQSVADATAEAKILCKEKTGRTMQEKATPIKEAIVVLDEKHNIEDLKNLGKVLQDRFGIQTIQAYIHRDEGHYTLENEWKPNLHAHMVFNFTDQTTGKSIKLNRQDLREMQTLVADTLGMKRGMSSDKRHLNSLQYTIQEQKKDLETLKKELSFEENNLAEFKNKTIDPEKLKSQRKLGFYSQSTVDQLINLIEVKEIALKRAENKITQLENRIKGLPTISLEEYERRKKQMSERERELEEKLNVHINYLSQKDEKIVNRLGTYHLVKISEEREKRLAEQNKTQNQVKNSGGSLTDQELKKLNEATWVRYNHFVKELRTSNNLVITNDTKKIMEALQISKDRKINIMTKGLNNSI